MLAGQSDAVRISDREALELQLVMPLFLVVEQSDVDRIAVREALRTMLAMFCLLCDRASLVSERNSSVSTFVMPSFVRVELLSLHYSKHPCFLDKKLE